MSEIPSLPTQIATISDEQHAVAPYNFVRLPEKVVPAEQVTEGALPENPQLLAQDRYYPDRHTGTIVCRIETSSPLFIRGMQDPRKSDSQAKDSPDFVYTTDSNKPIIPGSSLRGLIRSLVEIVAFGKVTMVNNELIPYRGLADMSSLSFQYESQLAGISVAELAARKAKAKAKDKDKRQISIVKAGFIERERGFWYIREATHVRNHTYCSAFQDSKDSKDRQFEGYQSPFPGVYKAWLDMNSDGKLTTSRLYAREDPRLEPVYIMLSGHMDGKKTVAVIYDKHTHGDLLEISDDIIQAYRKQLSAEQIKLLGKNGVLEPGHPVFYIVDTEKKVSFISHTRNMRVVYPHTMRDFVPEYLRADDIIDIPEAMFGFVRDTYHKDDPRPKPQPSAYASRLMFHDASLIDDRANYMEQLTPRILGGPKPTTFQHYLVQTEPNIKKLKHYGSHTVEEVNDNQPTDKKDKPTVIRGHKQYWHQGDVTQSKITDNSPSTDSKVHTRITPIHSGNIFKFTIDFENLSDVELGALCFVLSLCEDDTYRLKLGMGKPLGLGSIKLTIDSLELRNRSNRYTTLFDPQQLWNEGTFKDIDQQECINAFFKYLTDTHGLTIDHIHARLEDLFQLLTWHQQPMEDQQDQYVDQGKADKRTTSAVRYMEIKRSTHEPYLSQKTQTNKVNEYRHRPILPIPPRVTGKKNMLAQELIPIPFQIKHHMLYEGTVTEWQSSTYEALVHINEAPDINIVCRALRNNIKKRIQKGAKVEIKIDAENLNKGTIEAILRVD